MPPTIRKIDSLEQPSQEAVRVRPGSPEDFRLRAAYRRSPQSREDAQRQIDEGEWVDVILGPSADDEEFARRNDGNFPMFTAEINGVRMSFPIGEPVRMPKVFYEDFAHSRRLPIFRKQPGDPGVVFSREVQEGAGGAIPDFGR